MADVDQAMVDELNLHNNPESAEHVCLSRVFWGLFHAKLADTQGTLPHGRKSNTGARNPGSGRASAEWYTVILIRDALISREFIDAVKAGDSGRVILVLKACALSF